MNLKDYIGIREGFPKEGISFKDITPLLQNAEAFKETIKQLTEPFKNKGVTKILCADARGFIFGAGVALELNAGLSIARKPNKLPYVDCSVSYDLEYGSNTLEIAPGAIDKKDKVLIVDDLLATGGSARALTEMIHKKNADLVGYAFVIELEGIKGRRVLDKKEIVSLIKYDF